MDGRKKEGLSCMQATADHLSSLGSSRYSSVSKQPNIVQYLLTKFIFRALVLLTLVRLENSSALQYPKWQLIGMS